VAGWRPGHRHDGLRFGDRVTPPRGRLGWREPPALRCLAGGEHHDWDDNLCWGGTAVVAGLERPVPQTGVDGEHRVAGVQQHAGSAYPYLAVAGRAVIGERAGTAA